jgi:hypothetical protein
MSYFTRFILFLSLCFQLQFWAQPSKIINNKDSYNIMFGASWVMLDDDGLGANPFNFGQYHSLLFPTRVFFDKYIYQGWSVEGAGAFTKYNPEKLVNDSLNITGSLFSIDANIKYSAYKLLGSGAIDPYVGLGAGVTFRSLDARNTAKTFSPTINVSLGLNLWVSNNLGFQVQTAAKLGLTDFFKTSDYFQHTAGIVIRIEKGDGSKSDFGKSKYSIKKKHGKIKGGGKKQKES